MRCAVLADIHANATALRAVLGSLSGVDHVWCLGDVVGVGPDPGECVDLLRGAGATCVLGDHDLAAMGQPASKFLVLPALVDSTAWTRERLTPAHADFLAAQPVERVVAGVTLTHALGPVDGPPQPHDFGRFATAVCFVGHTHMPLFCAEAPPNGGAAAVVTASAAVADEPFELGGRRTIANPGSVGANRLDPGMASYMLLEWSPVRSAGTATRHQVPFATDWELEHRRSVGLPGSVIEEREQFLAGTAPRLIEMRERYAAWYPA